MTVDEIQYADHDEVMRIAAAEAQRWAKTLEYLARH